MSNSRFRQITEDDLPIIMKWRMAPEITKFMCTDPQLTLDDQKRWFERIKKEEDSFYWVYEVDGKPAGLVSLVGWDRKNSVIHSGAYIAEAEARTLQNIVDENMNLFAIPFERLGINRLAIEIMSNNTGMMKWAMRFGATKEGVLREAIHKNGEIYDLHLFSILAKDWPEIKKKVHYNPLEIEEKQKNDTV